jgi:vitamin K-dependent gamma-carboxylase
MMLDIPNERGMTEADIEFSSGECIFPLFDFLKPLPAEWMLIVYGVMFLGAFGIMIGFKYRFSCLCFLIPYWYLFFLDKTTWNNHSYLYGLIGLQLLLNDANRFL